MSPTFLSQAEIETLTGRKTKSKQIESLRRMGLPFFVNACGRPVIARSVIEGGRASTVPKGWSPVVLRA